MTYLKLAPWRGLPPRLAGTLPDREFPLRFLQKSSLEVCLHNKHKNDPIFKQILLQYL